MMRIRQATRASHRKDGSQAGFTLIELLVVVAIVGVVTAVAVVALLNALDRARQRASMADMRALSTAIEAYMIDNTFPPSQGDIVDVVEVLTPYYSSVLPTTDHWSNEFSYTTNGVDDYQLESFGRDGAPGADITLATRFDFDLDIVLTNGQFTAAPE